jgi:hypothetical protein
MVSINTEKVSRTAEDLCPCFMFADLCSFMASLVVPVSRAGWFLAFLSRASLRRSW